MLTSPGLRSDTMKYCEAGVASYLAKPIKQSNLRDVIKLVLAAPPGREDNAHPEKTQRSPRENLPVLTILLAEDNRVNQIVAVRRLEKRGHSVVVAETGTAVLRALKTQIFDLVLMDVQMPEMDGLEATIAIRQTEKDNGNHLPILAMTANAMIGDKEHCLQSGMDGYIAKPLSSEALFGAIDALLINHTAISPLATARQPPHTTKTGMIAPHEQLKPSLLTDRRKAYA
jgi:two-component system sensor histidine kinase/response regulator